MVSKLAMLLTVVSLLFMFNPVSAELIIDSVNYAIDIGDNYADPGDTIAVSIRIKNVIPLGGFLVRFTYDTNYVTSLQMDPCPGDECPGECCEPLIDYARFAQFDSVVMIGRGLQTITIDSGSYFCDPNVNDFDTSYHVFAFHDPDDDSIHSDAEFLTFLPAFPPFNECELEYWRTPALSPEISSASTIAQIYFVVNESPPGSSCVFRVEDYLGMDPQDPLPDYRDNQFADVTGNIVIRPLGAFGEGVLYISADYVCGDANGDMRFDILDIIYLIAFQYFTGSPPDSDFLADVNADGAVDLLDIYYLIQFKFSDGSSPDCN